MTTLYQNVGGLFSDDSLAQLPEMAEWSADALDESRRALEELLEKREALIEEGLDRGNTNYYWTSYVLRRLKYCYSVIEMTPNDPNVRPDFTLFYSADEFRRARDYRTGREFFSHSLGVMRAFGWDESLDEQEIEGQPANPAFDIDRFIRETGVNFGIMTNGRIWRLYHRDSAGLLNTYYEVDLIAALESNDLNAFRYFWTVFSPTGLGDTSGGEPLVFRLLD